jgi:hypothetical protein
VDQSEVLDRLRARIAAIGGPDPRAPAPLAAVAAAERVLEVRLPAFYARVVTELANGGFGPGHGILGLPPDGFSDDDAGGTLVDAYQRGRTGGDSAWQTPRGLLPLCSWGCGVLSYVDALSPDGAVVTDEVFAGGLRFTETASGLAAWLSLWASGVNLEADMYEVVGHREGINPFTGRPHRFPLRRRLGRPVDLAQRR